MLNDLLQVENETFAKKEAITPPKERDVFKMTADEIVHLFAWYDFTDELGHNLVNCQAFKNLVARATNR